MKKVKQPRKKVNSSNPMNGEALRKAVSWGVDGSIFSGLKVHGNTSWRVTELVLLAVVWVWSEQKTLTGAFHTANQWTIDLLGRSVLTTFQGMMGALTTWTAHLLPLIRVRLRQLMEQMGGEYFRYGGWVPLAVDGSRNSVPRTRANEDYFSSKTYGQSSKAKTRRKKREKQKKESKPRKASPQGPQIWTTLLWHMGLGMPWSWRTGPTTSCERRHFEEMLRDEVFPEKTLFCGDAGFVGYSLWQNVLEKGGAFLIRCGKNVTLLRELGYVREQSGIVYLWPQGVAKTQKQPPLVLRLIRIKIGKARISLVTNVLDEKRLTDTQAVQLYRMRWGVEVQFRTLKQTFERRMLRSRSPDRALVEWDWSILGVWLVQLFAVKEQIELGQSPDQCSVSDVIQIVREVLARWWERPCSGRDLKSRLGEAVKDGYTRKRPKRSRYLPKGKGRKPSCGAPIINKASHEYKVWLKNYLASVA